MEASSELSLGGGLVMIGAYSSRIVRGAGCAALTLLLAATACPTFGAPAARAVESLSAAERTSLPDTTLIKLKAGRTVSLGTLRTEHKLRLQRFADAAKLGKEHGALSPATHRVYGVPETPGRTLSIPTLIPMDFSLKNFNKPNNLDLPFEGPLPADFLTFCKAALVTACLYLPGGVPLLFGTNNAGDTDYLITDQNVCKGTGGTMVGTAGGCLYAYPLQYSLTFYPMVQGYNVTQSVNCALPFYPNVNPSGGVALLFTNTGPNIGNWITLPSLQSCAVSIYVHK